MKYLFGSTSIYTLFLTVTYLFILNSCSEPPNNESVAELNITKQEIRSVDDSLLLHIEDMPGSIPVEEGIKFGAAERFTDAISSPDRTWFAITTAGAAHSAGWLMESETKGIYPAAFQYGGSVSIGHWSRNGRYVSFIEKGPAPTHTLSIVDLKSLGPTVSETAIQVRLAQHAESVPPETQYESIKWNNGDLIFEVNDELYRYNTTTSKIRSD